MTEITITALGARGDGIAEQDGKLLHLPYALPGEVVEMEEGGERIARILKSSAERIAPICPLFGSCGGCRMQHLAPAPYGEWKRGIVEATLARQGIGTPVSPVVAAHGNGRRRVTLHVRIDKGAIRAGFMAARSHDLIDLDSCPVLVPALAPAAHVARTIARPLAGLGKPLDVQVTASSAGLDVDIRGGGTLTQSMRLNLTVLATNLDLARVANHGETIVERRAPVQTMGKALVTPPPGGFLQATAEGETVLAGLVCAAVGKAKRVADLFCGVGPFALRLAESRAVSAFDSERPAIEALTRAARATPGLRPIAAEARDLYRRPLLPHELSAFDAVVLDPPRAGAEAQTRQLARTPGLKSIVYVSCDPQSFARDACLLADSGFRLTSVTPVDQFTYSPHVELVGVFAR